jgi:hypothetical protein
VGLLDLDRFTRLRLPMLREGRAELLVQPLRSNIFLFST